MLSYCINVTKSHTCKIEKVGWGNTASELWMLSCYKEKHIRKYITIACDTTRVLNRNMCREDQKILERTCDTIVYELMYMQLHFPKVINKRDTELGI